MFLYRLRYSGWEEQGSLELSHSIKYSKEEFDAMVLSVAVEAVDSILSEDPEEGYPYVSEFNSDYVKRLRDLLCQKYAFRPVEYTADYYGSKNYELLETIKEYSEPWADNHNKLAEMLKDAGYYFDFDKCSLRKPDEQAD